MHGGSGALFDPPLRDYPEVRQCSSSKISEYSPQHKGSSSAPVTQRESSRLCILEGRCRQSGKGEPNADNVVCE